MQLKTLPTVFTAQVNIASINTSEGLYYLCGENKDPDQLHGYREADLRLCFRICKKPFFS